MFGSNRQDTEYNEMRPTKEKKVECKDYEQQQVVLRCLTSHRDLAKRHNRPASSC